MQAEVKFKVMVGMSGGVDSSVAAKLLLEQGYDVTGVTMKLFDGITDDKPRMCCSLTDVEDARSVCYKLGIEHFVFNFKDKFQSCVIDPFIESYLSGETPNPCILCNRHLKFDKMLRRARELDYDYIATGHYARIKYDGNRYLLLRPTDRAKDQTYVLYALTQKQLAHTLFPLGELTKSQVRAIAESAELVNAKKPDSQDICFVPDGDYAGFITEQAGEPQAGDFLDVSGNILGRHGGVIRYTIGQRKGLGMTFGKPMFVVGKDAAANTVTLGEESDLFCDQLIAEDVNFISIAELRRPIRITAKTRYSQTEAAATLEPYDSDRVRVTFDFPQRAISAGQAVVFYDGDIVVGGGTIASEYK